LSQAVHPADPATALVERALAEPDARIGVGLVCQETSIAADALAQAVSKAAGAHLRRDPRRVFWIARAAVRHARRAGAEQPAALAYRIAGSALAGIGRPRLALDHFDRALRILDRERDAAEIAAVQVKRVSALILVGRFAEAHEAARVALAIREARGDRIGVVEVECALGDIHFGQDRHRGRA
jgi:tetratricopeptide (TPR) repeat protein